MSVAALALAPGAVVDNLRIDRVLGQGAFGITYLVTDLVLDKSFALKEYLPPDLVSRGGDNRLRPVSGKAEKLFGTGLSHFLEEGRTVARLEHPNIVKVFRCFEANGTAYLLMPWYRGEALHKLLKRSGTFSAEEALALSRPLLNALEYIHGNSLVHQDIKPANIYITEDGQPILLDFGAAGQWLDASTSTRMKLGSEGYSAPEQSEPTGKTGPWTDIYGLAATLYRCVSGRIPVAAVQRQGVIGEGEPDPLPPLAEGLKGQDFSGIQDAITQGLSLDPASRPQSVAAWRRFFNQAGAMKSSVSGPLTTEVEQEGREWLSIILLGVFAVLLIAALVYLFAGSAPDPGDSTEETAVSSPVSETDRGEQRYTSPEETARWQDALDVDTAYGYQLFLQDYPDSIHRDQANVHLERLDHQAWGYAEEQGSKSAIETYLDTFPGGRHEAEANIRLHEFKLAEEAGKREQKEREQQDHDDWAAALARRSISAIDEYLAKWPGGLHGDEARSLRSQLEGQINETRAFEAAAKLNTIEAYESYVAAFPKGRNVARALEAIDGLTLRPGKTFRDCSTCPTMIVVPAGSFWQGSEESDPYALKMETPKRMVTFEQPFAVSVFEITMELWDQCVTDGACKTRPPDNGWGRGSRPVIMVSWNDTQEFTAWLSDKTGQPYRLPSESQWEYMARAGEESDWIGGDKKRVCEFGNIAGAESGFRWQHEDCADQAVMETLPVGSFKANAFGLYDVVGNVAEWTMDCMNLSYLDAPADGSSWGRGICSSRMTRGGSWFTGSREVRLPARFNLKNGDRNDFTGFRVVRKVSTN